MKFCSIILQKGINYIHINSALSNEAQKDHNYFRQYGPVKIYLKWSQLHNTQLPNFETVINIESNIMSCMLTLFVLNDL